MPGVQPFPDDLLIRADSAMPPKVRDILAKRNDDGRYHVGQKGSHRQLKHSTKPGRVTVTGKPGDDVPAGLLKSILRQAGLKR